MDSKKKILIVYGSLNSVPSPEGLAPAKVIQETAVSLSPKYSLKVLSYYNPKLKSFSYDRMLFCHVKPNFFDIAILIPLKLFFSYSRLKKLFGTSDNHNLIYFFSICRWIFNYKPSLIVVHVSTGLTLLIKSIFPKIPIIYYHHSTSLHTDLEDRQWSKLINGSTKAIISVNQIALKLANQKFNTKLPAQKAFTIYNGISHKFNCTEFEELKFQGRKFLNISNKDFVFMYIGRVTPLKGIHILLSAFKNLLQDNKINQNIHLVIVGGAGDLRLIDIETDYIKECKYFAKNHQLPVHFTGFLQGSSLTKVTAAADVGVLTTDQALSLEGHPLAIIEFFALGKPVIATAVGGIPEVVKDGINGFVLNEYPFERQLIQKMHLLINSPELLKSMGESAYRSFVENYTSDKMVASFEKVLSQIQL